LAVFRDGGSHVPAVHRLVQITMLCYFGPQSLAFFICSELLSSELT
jgi:hypothetical protein